MPKGKRSNTLEEKYNKTLEKKLITEESLAKVNEELKELETQIKMKRLSRVEELISKSGKSFEEIELILSEV